MKIRTLIISVFVAGLAAFSSAPRASAEPLTIIAIAGVATVLSAGSFDMMVSSYDDNRDQRAQLEETERMQAKIEAAGAVAGAGEAADAAPKPDAARSLE